MHQLKVRDIPRMRAGIVDALRNVPSVGNEAARHDATLPGASLWWVTPDMTKLAVHAAKSLPAWTPMIVRPEPTGFIVFGEPIGQTRRVEIPGFIRDEEAEPFLASGRIQAVHWSIDGEVLTLSFYGEVSDEQQRARSRPVWEAFYEIGVMMVPAMAEFDPEQRQIKDRLMNDVVHRLGAAWLLMQQPTVTENKQVRGRTGKRARQQATPSVDDIQIIDLRRLATDRSEPNTPSGEGREYHHRWMVRGHWRQQRVGPGRKYVKPVYVSPHIRGPEDAPLKTDRVNVWRR